MQNPLTQQKNTYPITPPDPADKWEDAKYNSPFHQWTPPPLIYPVSDTERETLHALKNVFDPLHIYPDMEARAVEKKGQVQIDVPIPAGYIAFLENTAEQCISPQTKHSREGMQGARHWVQRVDTPDGMFQRLTDGYGVSLMFGERHYQYIRNSNNWRGISGMMLDIDVFRDDKNPDAPPPCYSQSELFDRYPLLARICTYLIPSASSLYEDRPFKARGVILYPEPITDQRLYRAFGDILCGELDCIPANVTKNPVAVGFGNTHNAPQVYRNETVDTVWIADALEKAKTTALTVATQRNKEQKHKAKLREHYNKNVGRRGENISEFIDTCDAVAEMVREGLLTAGRGNEYRWHGSENDRSCEIFDDGVIHIFSGTMQKFSPAPELEPVNAHRFYLYQLSGLDLSKDSDKAKCREYLFDRGYGSDPKAHTHRKPVKLLNVEKYDKVIETLATARAFLKGIFEKGSNFFAIRTDTGTGKTENAITYAITRDVAIPTQSGTLRDEIVSRANDKEIFAWGYRGIRETEEADGYMPCIQSERFETLRNKGFNPYKWVCDSCPAYLECKQRGYLSQPDRAAQSQLVALPFPTAFLDPRLRSWADLYKPKGKDTLILHDDLPLTSLFVEYQLTAKRLRQVYEDWKGTLAAEWAEACLMAFQLRDWEMLKNVSLGMNADETESVRYALTQCVDPASGAVIEPDEYLTSERVDFSTAEACHKLPQIDKEGFDTATMLESFWEQYPRVEDAPFFYDAITDAFTFYRPPKPYIFNKSVRFGFASATLDPKLIKTIFPDIEFYNANTTEWDPAAHLYQLRTNRNPRATVLNAVEKYNAAGEKVWQWDGLSETGADYYGKVLSFIKSNPSETHAVISYKNVIADKQDELDALGVRTAHFGNLAGLDEAFEGVKNFHILFCPFVKPSDVDFLCKQLFGNEGTPLKRDATGNLERSDDGEYADDRAQQVNDALVTGELLQAIGRARLNLYPNRVFLWTSLFIDGVSNRSETSLFDEVDWQTADAEIEKLQDTVKRRENGEVKALAETTGQSERTARRQTQTQRQQSKAELQQNALARYARGESFREIGKALNKAPNTIKSWCQTAQF